MKSFKSNRQVLIATFFVMILSLLITGCSKKGIIYPKNDQCVKKGMIEIKWNPEDSPMIVQYYYKDSCMINCNGNPKPAWSGNKIKIDSTGHILIKIWRPGSAEPFDTVWVYVDDNCPDTTK